MPCSTTKNKTILKPSSKKGYYEQAALQNDLRLGEVTMKLQTETVHLGLIRTTSNETKTNIEEQIGLARRTLYSYRRYTAAVAVLFGNACNLLIVLRWKFVSSSRSFLCKCRVSSPYKSLGVTYT
jgi:hypothetical protein